MRFLRMVLDIVEWAIYTWVSCLASFNTVPDRGFDHPMMVDS